MFNSETFLGVVNVNVTNSMGNTVATTSLTNPAKKLKHSVPLNLEKYQKESNGTQNNHSA